MKKVIEGVLNLIYPHRCPFCETILPINAELAVCNECKHTLPYICEPRCNICSKPVVSDMMDYCFDCSKNNHSFIKGWALWLYNETVKKSIQRYKFFNKKSYGEIYANEVVKRFKGEIQEMDIDLIIPVPLYVKKQKTRGFNQSEVLAKHLSRMLNIPYDDRSLIRTTDTKPQKELANKERKENVKNIFKVLKKSNINDKTILIIDDIYTTGSTIDSCAKELLNNGAKHIYFLTLAIGSGL